MHVHARRCERLADFGPSTTFRCTCENYLIYRRTVKEDHETCLALLAMRCNLAMRWIRYLCNILCPPVCKTLEPTFASEVDVLSTYGSGCYWA